jgi:hypothetical protein
MKKVKLVVSEILKYNRKIIVEVPDNMTDAEIENALNEAEREFGGADEFVHALKKHGIQNHEGFNSDLDSPDEIESECEDYEVLED